MKIVQAFALLALITSCSIQPFGFSTEKKIVTYPDNLFIGHINSLQAQNKLDEDPLIVIDGFELSLDFLAPRNFNLDSSEIAQLVYIPKGNSMAHEVYGSKGLSGVILLRTPEPEQVKNESFNLCLLDNVKVPSGIMHYLPEDIIASMEVLDEKAQIKKFNRGGYDKVMIIQTIYL